MTLGSIDSLHSLGSLSLFMLLSLYYYIPLKISPGLAFFSLNYNKLLEIKFVNIEKSAFSSIWEI